MAQNQVIILIISEVIEKNRREGWKYLWVKYLWVNKYIYFSSAKIL